MTVLTTRFLHTSDLQLGMTRWFLQETEDAQALFDAARVEAITRLGEKAIEYQCDFIIVAGDVFEHNSISAKTRERALAALAALPVDVYLLNPLDRIRNGQNRNDPRSPFRKFCADAPNQRGGKKGASGIVDQHPQGVRRQGGKAAGHGILPGRAAVNGNPGQPQIVPGVQGPQAIFFLMPLQGRKNKDQPPDTATAAHGPGTVPVQGCAAPEKELFGRAASRRSEAAALTCGKNHGPRLFIRPEQTGRVWHGAPFLLNGSRTISRVLSYGFPYVTVIPLGVRLPAPSSNLPGRLWPGQPPSLFGLAPNGVCLACRVTAASGGLLLHRFTLTPTGAVCFLWRCPRVAPPGCYPAFRPAEPGLSSPGACLRRRPVRLPLWFIRPAYRPLRFAAALCPQGR